MPISIPWLPNWCLTVTRLEGPFNRRTKPGSVIGVRSVAIGLEQVRIRACLQACHTVLRVTLGFSRCRAQPSEAKADLDLEALAARLKAAPFQSKNTVLNKTNNLSHRLGAKLIVMGVWIDTGRPFMM